MTLQEGDYGIRFQSPAYVNIPWDYIKKELDMMMSRDIYSQLVGDGLYHVIKADYLKDENCHPDIITYYARISHTVAQIRQVNIPSFVEYYQIPATAREVCRWCGNSIVLDKRGGCSACGGPGGSGK